ncbi:Glycoside hydrolase [Macleaya cordata]|uniref:Beta-amylase n=1 Tax=Macleaya cordata TaxID=56857 RepID=A0A200Q1M4_MACCD|nr:Glycoside hydrolase [Macleaya cordata]
MEVSVVRCNSQVKIVRTELAIRDELSFCKSKKVLLFKNNNRICFDLKRSSLMRGTGTQVVMKAIQFESSLSSALPAGETSTTTTRRSAEKAESVRLFVGLPLDCISYCNTLSHTKAITAGLKALKLLGVEGVEFPVWWGIVEREKMGKYDWSSYLALAELIRDVGLKIRISLCFHGNKESGIQLPQWVSQTGESQPDIYFTDRSGRRYKECLSLAVDDLPVLEGKTAMQVYQEFMESFKSSFSASIGTTITDIKMGLGPDGELRYPSQQHSQSSQILEGVGEFQCYDKHMLDHLKQHAQASGNPNWGLSGPHDAPSYDQSLNSNTFFKENGGSWETQYGDFFLSWYSNQLIKHGDCLLSLAFSTFCDSPMNLLAKIPLLHSWYKTRSHPSEMTAGFYNVDGRDSYEAIAELFARNSFNVVLPGMDLSDEQQSHESFSSPELLLSQIKKSCIKHGVQVSGENSTVSGVLGGFDQIKKNLLGENLVIDSFTYQRMGAYFFSPEHFSGFTKFVRNLVQAELHSDDLPTTQNKEATVLLSTVSRTEKNLQMQVA